MIGSIAKFVLSAAATAGAAVFKSELEQGATLIKQSLGMAVNGRGAPPPSADLSRASGDASLGQFAVAGLILAGVGALCMPQVRNAVLDFHDGALRKLGERLKTAVEGGPATARSGRDWSVRVADEPEGDLEPAEHDFEPATAVH
jgi:hypothetical protein